MAKETNMFNGSDFRDVNMRLDKIEDATARVYDYLVATKLREPTAQESSEEMMMLLSKNSRLVIQREDLKNDLVSLQKEMEKELGKKDTIIKNLEKRAKPKRARRKPLTQKAGYTKITPEEERGFKEMYDRGLSILEIATQTGRSSSSISNHLRSMGETGE